ncbi:LuxR C-terminal-related transcriptional regulator [Streptomyces javensis]|uniref:response regulator transcription factor n=1 Tax=Streptomyces javensis TaxID=114698 RepID=UPI0033FA2D0B
MRAVAASREGARGAGAPGRAHRPRGRDAHALARGLSNAEIGRELRLSETTVKAHISRSLTKLNLTNRVQPAILVQDAGLADEGAPGDG